MRYILFVCCIVAAGCYTPKKADKQLAKASLQYPEKVASICSKEYPCKPGKTDTIEKVYLDLIEVECPDYPIPSKDTIRDTIQTTRTKIVKVEVQTKERVITKYIIDSSLVKVYSNKYEACAKEADMWKYKVKSKMNWIWALLALVVILSTWLILKHRK